jgi:hypothetical protein
MKKVTLFAVALALVASSGAGLAQEQAETFKGTLIDNACFNRSEMSQEDLASHTRNCALMDGCIRSGYALVTADDHVFKLDAAGNEKAVEMLKASDQSANLKVTVTGTNTDGTITVASIALDSQ